MSGWLRKVARSFVVLGAACMLSAAAPTAAHADARDPAAAEALFDEARQLMKDGRYARACSLFEASQKLDPGVGTLLNLGDCLEKVGRVASAWVRFREAASAALSAGQTEREQIARARAAALDGKLARLVVRVAEGAGEPQITKDGVSMDRAAWGSAVPLDPGLHALEATMPGKKPWRRAITVPETPAVLTVDVPPLEDAAPPPPPIEPALAAPSLALTPAPAPSEEKHGLGTQRGVAIGVGSVGAVALFLAGGFALSARSVYEGARSHCTSAGCDPDGVRLGHDAGTSADVATVSVIVGGVALAAAAVLWLTAK
jgi:tetratricopeptide (TPR) repeat protein